MGKMPGIGYNWILVQLRFIKMFKPVSMEVVLLKFDGKNASLLRIVSSRFLVIAIIVVSLVSAYR